MLFYLSIDLEYYYIIIIANKKLSEYYIYYLLKVSRFRNFTPISIHILAILLM